MSNCTKGRIGSRVGMLAEVVDVVGGGWYVLVVDRCEALGIGGCGEGVD